MFRCSIRMRTSLTAFAIRYLQQQDYPCRWGHYRNSWAQPHHHPSPQEHSGMVVLQNPSAGKQACYDCGCFLTMGHHTSSSFIKSWKHQKSMPILLQAMSFCKGSFDLNGNINNEGTIKFWKAALDNFIKYVEVVSKLRKIQDRLNQRIWTVVDNRHYHSRYRSRWSRLAGKGAKQVNAVEGNTYVKLDNGLLTVDQLNMFLNAMPFELTYADDNNSPSITTISTRNQIPCWVNGSWNRSETGCRRFTAPSCSDEECRVGYRYPAIIRSMFGPSFRGLLLKSSILITTKPCIIQMVPYAGIQ